MNLTINQQAIASVLGLYSFTSIADLQVAAANLAGALSQSMQNTQCYSLSPEQQAPAGTPPESLFAVVHPHNVAVALHSIVTQHNDLSPTAPASIAPGLQLYVPAAGGWQMLEALSMPRMPVNVQLPPPPVAAPPPAPSAIAPAPVAAPPAPPAPPAAPPAAPVATQQDVAALVDQALSQPAQTNAPQGAGFVGLTEQQAKLAADLAAMAGGQPLQQVVEQPAAEQQVVEQPAVEQPVVELPVATQKPVVEQPAATQQTATALPDASVSAPKTNTASGRPKASAFTKDVKPRSKVAEAPFWWASMLRAAPRLFTHVPSEAIDDSSEGSAPVQSYAALLELVRVVLEDVPADVSVAELRVWTELVRADIANQPSAAAINQIRDSLFG